MATKSISRPHWRRLSSAGATALLMFVALTSLPPATVAAAAPTVSIAQYPLTVAVPAHPQVLFAVGNSQSMDGDLSGAIYTGSGGLPAGLSALNASSSPVDYTVPADFTAPVTGTTAGNSAPYTVTSGLQYDNSASRLNVAKAGITSILQNFLSNADFGLIDYQTGGLTPYTTWVYYMSPSGGFSFTNTSDASSVANPCYNVTALSPTVYGDCVQLNGHYGENIGTYQYMETAATDGSSDDPDISDVLYAGGLPALFVSYSGPHPTDPYTTYSLGVYNDGGVQECYNLNTPSIGGGICETPTNAGFVPWSTEVMNVERGFGFYTTSETSAPATTTSWAPLVPMASAGQVPTTTSVNAALAQFTPYLAPETSSTGTTEIKAQATQSPIAGLLQAAGDYYSAKNPASTNGCTPNRYIVLVTDGLPTLDLSGHNWPPLGSTAAAGYGVTASFNGNGSLNTTNDQALTDTINTLTTLQNETAAQGGPVKTYVIGLGAGVSDTTSPAGQTLTAMAVAGGTNTYFSAQNVAQLDQAMQVILAQILAETAATSSSSVNSTGINTTSVAYQGQFTTSDTYQDWTGNLLAYPINATTGYINTSDSAAQWSAQALLDAKPVASRLIATWDPVAGKGIPFEWNSSTSAINGIASSTTMGQDLMTFAADTNGQDVLNYLRGTTTLEKRNGGQFRNRSHILGDIVDSSPLYIGSPDAPWQQSSYFSFQAMYAHREPMVYIGSNDGMLHAFDANTGNEVFAYIPEGVYGNLVNLASPYYNEQHHFYVDGSPQVADVQFSSDNSWHTILLGSERAGGSTIFALDVTDPSQFTSEAAVGQAALWEFTDGDMGLSYSTPVAVSTTAGFAVIFGNGYDSPNNKPVVYALNPQTGAVLAKVDLCAAVPTACNSSLPNGLSNVVAMNTTGAFLSGTSNVLYAGDLQGNLWRVNISNPNPALWSVSVLFQARDSSDNPQPITVTPAVTLNPLIPTLTGTMVYFGTGQLLGIPDLGNTQVQSVYGIYDSGTAPATSLTRGDLQVQTMSSVDVTTTQGVNTSIRLLTSNPVNLPVKHGWFVDLNLVAGERVVTDPVLFNGTLQLTTYQPNTSTCNGGGNAWYMVFNYATGGATAVAQFDWNGTNSITSADLHDGQTVSGVSLGSAYAAGPKMVTGAGGAVVYTTSGGAQITSGGGAGQCTSVSGTTTCIPNWTNADALSRGAWQEIR